MTDRSFARHVFRAGALCNVVATVPAIVAPDRVARAFGAEVHYSFLTRLWAVYACTWGLIFAEVARAPEESARMVKWTWIEKAATAAVVLSAVARGRAPRRLGVLVVLTDVVWIPVFMVAQVRQLRAESR
jgi:hypothetical protein